MSTTIYLMRHAETLFNVQGKTQGWCDSPLTERGIEQARLAGLEYARRGIAVDRAYSSTSERCCDTLEIATEAAYGAPLPYERMKGLKELNFGSFEGKDQFLEPHGDGFDTFYVQFGGEAHASAVARFERALVSIAERGGHGRSLVVSHGGISINFYLRWESCAEVPLSAPSNCLTYVYEYGGGTFRCVDLFAPDFSSLEGRGACGQLRGTGPRHSPSRTGS